jgi:hypothetical protein
MLINNVGIVGGLAEKLIFLANQSEENLKESKDLSNRTRKIPNSKIIYKLSK